MRAAQRAINFEHFKLLLGRLLQDLGGIHVFRLMKIFYLVEWTILRKTGTPFSEVEIVRLPQGPAIDRYQSILDDLQDEGFIQQVHEVAYPNGTLIELVQEEDFDLPEHIVRSYDEALVWINSIDLYDANALQAAAYQTPPMRRIEQDEETNIMTRTGQPVFDTKWVSIEDFENEDAYWKFYIWNRKKTFGEQPMRKEDLEADLQQSRRLAPLRPQI